MRVEIGIRKNEPKMRLAYKMSGTKSSALGDVGQETGL